MSAAEPPIQPLPPWMERTWLQVGPSSSILATIQYPQTYSGPSLPGLTWPWVYPPTDLAQGTAVSIIGGPAGLITIGGQQDGDSTPSLGPGPSATSSSSAGTPDATPTSILSPTLPISVTSSSSSATLAPSSVSPSSTSASSDAPTTSTTPSSAVNSSSSTFSSASPPTSTSTRPSNETVPSQTSDPLSGGAIAGITIGVLAALLFLLLLLLCFCRRRRRKRKAAFTMLDPESRQNRGEQEAGVPAVGNRRASNRQTDANNLAEVEDLLSHEYRIGRTSEQEQRVGTLPPIMLQSPDSGESVRHCPSNSSLITTGGMSAANTDSTKTRASLISQFPVYDRRPSDRSSEGDHEGGGDVGGSADGPSGTQASDSQDRGNSGSGKTTSDRNLFSAPPPRPPSRTRSVPAKAVGTSIGLGRPPTSPRGPRSPRLSSLPEASNRAENEQPSTFLSPSLSAQSTRLERNMSNRSSRSLLGAPLWMKGFTWLNPFFAADSPDLLNSEQDVEKAEDRSTPEQVQAGDSDQRGRLLPTAAPVMRETPGYRRVTTTAAAYDIQDLRDLSRRPLGMTGTDLEEHNESEEEDEGRSLLESPVIRTPPISATMLPQGSSRWSRATLGQRVQRISGFSSVSLVDIRSISESMTSSARARNKSRSRSGSQSESSQLLHGDNKSVKSPTSTLSRASSRGTSSHGHSHSSRSRSGTGSEAAATGRHAARRHNNSSGGSHVSSSQGSHPSVKSGRSGLRRVQEDSEAVPALPSKSAAYA